MASKLIQLNYIFFQLNQAYSVYSWGVFYI